MDCQRDRIIKLVSYLESLGIDVNIAKNKARGNKGFFAKKGMQYRIDISKHTDENQILSTLLHEFAHYLHSKYDATLNSLDFIFDKLTSEEENELIDITVQNIPKDFAESLYSLKNNYINENKVFVSQLKKQYPDFKLTGKFKPIETKLNRVAKYLLKYDRVKFDKEVYCTSTLEKQLPELSFDEINYIKLKSNQRKISKVNSKINRLNKYYNQPTELWARFFESYFTNKENTKKLAPKISERFEQILHENKIKEINNLIFLL